LIGSKQIEFENNTMKSSSKS